MKKFTKKQTSVRLPRHILPIRYAVQLKPDLESFTFQGEETISIEVTKADRVVTLHGAEIEIVSAEYIKAPSFAKATAGKQGRGKRKPNQDNTVWSSKVSYNVKAETVSLSFPKPLPKGKGKLKLVFRGVLNDKLRGYYRSTYTHEGKTKHFATTQFEATDARRAFPCFDEPNLKAVFDVTLIVPSHHTAISNTMPAIVNEHEAGWKAVTFSPTPKMSTYLLAFISGELECIEGKTKSTKKHKGTLVRVFTTPGKVKQARFALEFSIRTLEFFQKYFEISYPLPVLDLIAIPDFMSGAMENWGAVTFRETALLIDADQSTTASKQYVAMVIAHELAHQWFGNLVTMDWWTHLWLNEGFASYIEYLAIHQIYPEWHVWNQFLAMDYAPAMAKDQLVHTHPIEVEVHHPREIDEIFDDISYHKGASVIRMLAEYLGAEDFRKGLVTYLRRHSYKNASTDDLWLALEQVSHKPVRSMMSAWTKQEGFPLISITEEGKQWQLSQKRFYINPRAAKTSKDTSLWPVPVSLQNSQGKLENVLLSTKTQTILSTHTPKLNLGETGFFRVGYTPDMLRRLAPRIQKQELGVIDRWGVIHTAFALAESGHLDAQTALTLALSYRTEPDFTVFGEVLSGILTLGSFYKKEKWYPEYQAFVRYMLAPTVKRLGWEAKKGEQHGDTLLRSGVLFAYGRAGDEATVSKALKLFTDSVRTKKSIHPDLRNAVYGLVANAGGVPEFNYFKQQYIRKELHEEKARLMRALCLFQSESLSRKALEFAFSKDVRTQDSWRFLMLMSGRSSVHNVLWKFVRENWSTILERYGSGGSSLIRTVQSLSHFHEQTYYTQVKKFFATRPVPGAKRALEQTLEHIETSSLWQVRDRGSVEKFIKGR